MPVEIINLIRSIHQGMKARICLNGTTLDEIHVEKGWDVAGTSTLQLVHMFRSGEMAGR